MVHSFQCPHSIPNAKILIWLRMVLRNPNEMRHLISHCSHPLIKKIQIRIWWDLWIHKKNFIKAEPSSWAGLWRERERESLHVSVYTHTYSCQGTWCIINTVTIKIYTPVKWYQWIANQVTLPHQRVCFNASIYLSSHIRVIDYCFLHVRAQLITFLVSILLHSF